MTREGRPVRRPRDHLPRRTAARRRPTPAASTITRQRTRRRSTTARPTRPATASRGSTVTFRIDTRAPSIAVAHVGHGRRRRRHVARPGHPQADVHRRHLGRRRQARRDRRQDGQALTTGSVVIDEGRQPRRRVHRDRCRRQPGDDEPRVPDRHRRTGRDRPAGRRDSRRPSPPTATASTETVAIPFTVSEPLDRHGDRRRARRRDRAHALTTVGLDGRDRSPGTAGPRAARPCPTDATR